MKQPLLDAEKEGSLGAEFLDMAGTAVQLSSTKIVRILLTTIDAAFLGHLGTKQLAAVALSAQLQGVPSAAIQFTIQAVTTLASQARGAGNRPLVGEWLQTALIVAVVGSIPTMLLFYNVHRVVAITMADKEVVEYARLFSEMMAWSLLPQYLYVALTSWFATIGVMMPATFATCVTVVANALFNWFFIYGYGSFEGLGFVGSPLATVASSYLQLLVFCGYAVVIKGYHKEYWAGWSRKAASSSRIVTFLELGLPTAMSALVDWAAGALAGSFAGLAGVTVAAAQNVLTGLFALSYSTVSGFSTATQIRLARYLGEGKPQAAKRILAIGSATMLIGAVLLCAVIAVYHDSVWKIWTSDPELVVLCDKALFAFMASVVMCYVRFMLTVVSVSLGPKEARVNLIANTVASWGIYIPLAYLMPISWGWGLSGFWWSDFYGEVFKVACLGWCVMNVDWEQAARDAQAKAAVSRGASRTEYSTLSDIGARAMPSLRASKVA
ncbi:hypothetical protein EMIHUDRAFT_107828 [Emiliania huxleyi CCMP1516]|uniref:Uncharacterized protein n=2 Tax=Emiliania huxleyi TaxID=2903 RepID=A0A0D3HYX9_EMIH1|nr:hypothetical protein EMIHUDRAFT_107828 [Emiliania huxleyi CCMP1516]EOD04214.1 hypothetical protein EMIHUDRAFT_107828 [Emiliania huxleyi CCMP1516]|eukprot:XP_005756643.1 hypothetical protein EMIHUDRAFT_107828 [Emiliania huxleyi CCMP1516]